MRCALLMTWALVFLAGCAIPPTTGEEKNHDMTKDDLKEALIRDDTEALNQYVMKKLRVNGPAILCEDDDWRRCYPIDASRCVDEMAPINQQCIQRIDDRLGGLRMGENDGDYIGQYVECLYSAHLESSLNALDLAKLSEVAQCLSNWTPDAEAAVQRILR